MSFKGDDGATLAGTVQVPIHQGANPAMLLIAGSGPTDRNGNQLPALKTDLLKQIADSLADQGIVTLRFDKRGMDANLEDLPKDRKNYGDFFTWEHFAGDAVAAVQFLRQQPEVDRERVGILGHSEGGILALQAARALKAEGHAPLVLVLISTPGRPIDRVIADQLKRLLAQQRATPGQSKYFLTENARITQKIQQTGVVPADVPPGLAALYPSYAGKFLRSELAIDPPKLAADFSGPVLLLAGAADNQVSSDLDAGALDAALRARTNDVHELLVIPNASHNLKLLKNANDPGLTGPVAPAATEQLKTWIAVNLPSH